LQGLLHGYFLGLGVSPFKRGEKIQEISVNIYYEPLIFLQAVSISSKHKFFYRPQVFLQAVSILKALSASKSRKYFYNNISITVNIYSNRENF